jgi:hypothetical protein
MKVKGIANTNHPFKLNRWKSPEPELVPQHLEILAFPATLPSPITSSSPPNTCAHSQAAWATWIFSWNFAKEGQAQQSKRGHPKLTSEQVKLQRKF